MNVHLGSVFVCDPSSIDPSSSDPSSSDPSSTGPSSTGPSGTGPSTDLLHALLAPPIPLNSHHGVW